MRWVLFLTLLALCAGPSAALAFEAAFLAASHVDLDNPHDVKLSPDGTWLFVSDVGNDRVVMLDAETLALIGHFGEDEQNGTHDVDLDAEGRLYVADTHNHRIAIYQLDGTAARLVGEVSGGFRKPEGVLVGPGARVYVTGAGSGNLLAFENGAVTHEMGGLSSPHDVAFAPNGDLWIADAGNDRMIRVTPELEMVAILQGAPYDFDGQRYLDVAPDGTLVVADKYAHQVKVIAENGALLGVIGSGAPGEGPGRFRTPEGVALKGDKVWIADSGNDRIVTYRLTWE